MNFELTLPKQTVETAPVSTLVDLGLNKTIKSITVHIPDGHKYLAGLEISTIYGRVLVPALGSNARWLRGNGNDVVVPISAIIEGPPYLLYLKGYNEDDTYNHTFYIDIS